MTQIDTYRITKLEIITFKCEIISISLSRLILKKKKYDQNIKR